MKRNARNRTTKMQKRKKNQLYVHFGKLVDGMTEKEK